MLLCLGHRKGRSSCQASAPATNEDTISPVAGAFASGPIGPKNEYLFARQHETKNNKFKDLAFVQMKIVSKSKTPQADNLLQKTSAMLKNAHAVEWLRFV
jgi:hypothetical protein